MARLTTAARNALPDSDFAGPNRTYPVEDAAHERNALSRVGEFGSPALKRRVSRKVAKVNPSIKQQALAKIAKGRR